MAGFFWGARENFSNYFCGSLHSLADGTPNGVRGIFFHVRRGMGIGTQGEASAVVAQHVGQGLHIYPVL